MNKDTYITVNVIINNRLVDRQIDLSRLSLSELLRLREHYKGNFNNLVTKIDAILHNVYLSNNACAFLNRSNNRTKRKMKEIKNGLSNKRCRR